MTAAQLIISPDAIYEALDRKRRQLRMHRSDVARELGISPSAFTRLDHGRVPSATTLIRAMAWLGADVTDYTTKDGENR